MTTPGPTAGGLQDIRHVIGLDIGDGESALAWSSPDNLGPVEIYRRPTGEQSILTALSYVPADDCMPGTVFGEDAVLTDRAFQFTVNFKQRPQFVKVAEFAKALLDEFHALHPEAVEGCVIFVGHPAGWDARVTESYARHMAILGPAVYLLAESQSALVHVRDLNRERHGEGMVSLDNVLVIDIGSSTVDFTVVDDLIPRNIPVGANLGCKQIDSELAELVISALARDLEFTAAMRRDGARDLLLLTCRRAKEAQFNDAEQTLQGIKTWRHPDWETIADRGFGFLKSLEISRVVRRPGGWADKFSELLAEVERELARQPEAVLLTGGGSRMPFVRQLSQDAFPGARILPEPSQAGCGQAFNPSLSVAQGLASAGCQQVRIARFRRDMRAIVTSKETAEEIRYQAERTFNTIRDSLVHALRHGKPPSEELTANPPGRDEAVAELQASINARLVARAQQVCEMYGIDNFRFSFRLELPLTATTVIMEKIRQQAEPLGMGTVISASLTPFMGLLVQVLNGGLEAKRDQAIRTLAAAQLAPEDTARIISDVQASFTDVMEERASAVERFVT